MIENLVEYFKDKKILILGFGVEGKSTYLFLRKYLKKQRIYIADKKANFNKEYDFLEKDENTYCISGENYLDNLEDYDIIMKSPGISFAHMDISKIFNKIKSELELLMEFINVYTIGVTGTKGKSTTSSLIYNVLKEQGKDVLLLGNIGTPVFDYLEKITENTILVLEMSSHQLEYMKVSPNISILLNIYEEHLDHYESYEKYIEAKCNIFKYQKENDAFIYNEDNEVLNKTIKKYDIKSCKYKVSLNNVENEKNKIYYKKNKVYFENEELYNSDNERKLLGMHNLNNIMFALCVGKILKLDLSKTVKTISNFEPLEHRLEFVGKYDDVLYYNDSIATIPEATINSIEALKNVNTLIIGGMDRGVNFEEFIKYLEKSNVEHIICMPTTGHYIGKQIHDEDKKIYFVQDLEEAVKTAKHVTRKNEICVLSPAAASYGFFKNFKEKGEAFKKLVSMVIDI